MELDAHGIPWLKRRIVCTKGAATFDVVVCDDEGVLVLRGQAPTYYHTQLAQEMIRMVAVGYAIERRADVHSPPDPVRARDLSVTPR